MINISSVASSLTPPNSVIYSGTKGAVDAITRVLAKELGPRGITVNVVSPGPTDTELFGQDKTEEDKRAVELILAQQVFGRPYLAPPGFAAEPLKILRAAFVATMQDAEFLADAERTRIDVVPSSGERVQQLVEQLYATPKATVERAKDLIKP